jgi:hypothetical protein
MPQSQSVASTLTASIFLEGRPATTTFFDATFKKVSSYLKHMPYKRLSAASWLLHLELLAIAYN